MSELSTQTGERPPPGQCTGVLPLGHSTTEPSAGNGPAQTITRLMTMVVEMVMMMMIIEIVAMVMLETEMMMMMMMMMSK